MSFLLPALLLAETEPTSLGVIMAIVAVVMAVVKIFERVIDYFIAEVRRKRADAAAEDGPKPGDSGRLAAPIAEVVARTAKQVGELHTWHSVEVPDQPGVKVWWNTEEQKRAVRELAHKIEQLFAALQRMNSAHQTCNEGQIQFIQKQRDAVEELRRRVDALQEQRLADRDMLYERVIKVTESFAARIERGVDSGSSFGQSTVEPESDK